MALATFKDLCIDATDPLTLGRFWAGALGLELHEHEDGDTHLTGPTPGHTIWVNKVPEPKTVKQRLHLDVNVHDVAELEKLGATVLDDSFRWTVMADPEGGELCAFVREGVIEQRIYEIGFDVTGGASECHDQATWWATALGATVVDDEGHGYSYIESIPGAPFESIDFVPVPEPKTVKNRIHLDVTGRVEDLVAAGATVLRAQDDTIGWTVMADPQGNEFCAFAP